MKTKGDVLINVEFDGFKGSTFYEPVPGYFGNYVFDHLHFFNDSVFRPPKSRGSKDQRNKNRKLQIIADSDLNLYTRIKDETILRVEPHVVFRIDYDRLGPIKAAFEKIKSDPNWKI